MEVAHKQKDVQRVETLFQYESKCIMFDDILGAPVVRNRTNVEIPLPQAPLEVEEEEEEEGKEEEKEKEAETE